MKEIFHICFMNTIPFWGGGEKWYYDAINHFSTCEGVKVSAICSRDSKLAVKLKESQIEIHENTFSNVSFLFPWKQNSMEELLREIAPDVIIMNSSLDLKHAAKPALKAEIPVRIYRRGYGGSIRKNRRNNLYFSEYLTHIITNSNYTASQFNTFDEPGIHDKIHTLYNDIEVEKYYHVETVSDEIQIGTSSRLIKQKRVNHILGALKILDRDDLVLHIAGIGEEMAALRQLSEELNLKGKIVFHGFIDDIPSFLSELDFFIHPGADEAFGFSVVEAMASELPVIAYRSGAMPEIILDGKTGFLCEDENIPCLAKKIKILAYDGHLRKRMGKMARARVTEKFNREKQLRKLEEMLREWA